MTKEHLIPYKAGQSGNPGGRPKLDPAIKKFKETSYEDFVRALQKYGSMTKVEINADLKRPEASMFDLMFGNLVLQAAKGNAQSRQLLIDRLWGKLKDSDVHINIGKMDDKELIAMAHQAIKILSSEDDPLMIEAEVKKNDEADHK